MALEDQKGAVEAESVIAAEFGALFSHIERLEHQVGRLAGRVSPVLGGPRPEAVPTEPESEFFGSDVAQRVHSARLAVARMAESVAEIVERLET